MYKAKRIKRTLESFVTSGCDTHCMRALKESFQALSCSDLRNGDERRLASCETFSDFVSEFMNQVFNRRIATDIEAAVVQALMRDLGRDVLVISAEHGLATVDQIANDDWWAIVVNEDYHFDVLERRRTSVDFGGRSSAVDRRGDSRCIQARRNSS